MTKAKQMTKSIPKELPPGWEWQHRDKRVPAFRAEKPWANLRTLSLPTEAEAILAAYEIEKANEEGLAGLAGKGLVSPNEEPTVEKQVFRVCGCTTLDCRQCIEKTGQPCHWVEPDLCSACFEPPAIAMLRSLDDAPAASNGHHPQMLRMISVDQIEPSPTNPRKYFDPDKLQELADSIIEHGLVEPILVRPIKQSYLLEDAYQLVAGERRWRAVKLAGLTMIEAKVRDLDDQAALEIQMIENLRRDDLSPIEEADGYAAMLSLTNDDGTSVYTVDTLAARIGKKGKSKSYVYGRLKLRNLPLGAMDAIAKGDLPATVAELIGRLPSMEMRQIG